VRASNSLSYTNSFLFVCAAFTPGCPSSGYLTATETSIDSAAAGNGFVGSSSYAALAYPIAPYYGNHIVAQTVYAAASVGDLYLVGPTSGTVNYSLNLSVTGSIGGSGYGSDRAASASFLGQTTGQDGCASAASGTIAAAGGSSVTATGIFAGGPSWSGATPSVCTGSNGEAITAYLQPGTAPIALLDGTENGDPGSASIAYVNYADPAMFSNTGPLFNFSEPGWTVDSTDGCVADNRYVCSPSHMPEPASLLLFGSALAGIVLPRLQTMLSTRIT